MTPEIRNALRVKRLVSDFMKEHVYRGDYDRPRIKPDRAGAFHYSDQKVRISCAPNPRESWANCMVEVHLVRRRLIFRKLETVLSTGYGVDVYTFRPGMWVEYVERLARPVEGLEEKRLAERQRQEQEEQARRTEENFSPVDDDALFNPPGAKKKI